MDASGLNYPRRPWPSRSPGTSWRLELILAAHHPPHQFYIPEHSISYLAARCHTPYAQARASAVRRQFELTATLNAPPDAAAGTIQPSTFNPNESHDNNDRYLTSSFQQREQRARALGRLQSAFSSRPSSSSGSASLSLRRTPGIEDLHRPQSRSASAGPSERLRAHGRPQVRFEDPASNSSHPRSASVSAVEGRNSTHPALRISRRTAAAILVALESTRTPLSFTPDLVEENAQMADLGRASNGGARGGPVPVGGSGRPGVVPPTEIMRRRAERAAQAAAAEEQRRQQSAQAPAAIQPTDPQSQPSTRRHSRRQSEADANRRSSGRPISDSRQDDPRISMSQQTTFTNAPPQPLGPSQAERPSYEQPPPRTRANTQGSLQPRLAPPQGQPGPSGAQRTSAPQNEPQYEPETDSSPLMDERQYEQQTAQAQRPAATASRPGFPHAFQRWEDLSAKWEGLTGYWLRRIEQTAEETRDQPLNTQLSRQITDLSAAGGNLFHALVELQRLRASSERKFQRWFFETRKNEERTQEISAQLERALVAERQARADDIASWEAKVEQAKRTESNASKLLGEMRRELEISKGESRRAWEELGRREEEERERVAALKEGQAIVVGGYTVHPKQFQQESSVGGSMSQSQSQRPTTSYGQSQAAAEREYQQGPTSPTDTDPFTEMRPQQSAAAPSTLAWQSEAAAVGAAAALAANQAHQQQQSGRTSASSSAITPTTYVPAGVPQSRTTGYQNDQPSYESRGSLYSQQNTNLHPNATAVLGSPTATYATHTTTDEYGSELEEGYEMDEHGNVVRDASGRPIPYRRGLHRLASQSGESEDSDNDREATHSAAVEEYERQEAEMQAAPRQREQDARQALAREQQAWEREQERHQQRMTELQLQAAQTGSSTTVSYPPVPASSSAPSTVIPYYGSRTPSPPQSQTTSMRMPSTEATAGGIPPRSFFGTPSPPPEMRTSADSTGAFTQSALPVPAPPADYTGAGYGARWDPVHHQPTRLSDVMEEEDEARSRISSRSLGLGRSSGAPF
ncbi:hypothetical protein FKW77_010730 [Venturia effusa]|uniref:Uncharacterized protein n=1 Tax=Venturia effusa TaxID=50376 RepID=A0A517KYA5_9PEZI|nr:hypothetical protein FKW77_010730 [Venturia effusa]